MSFIFSGGSELNYLVAEAECIDDANSVGPENECEGLFLYINKSFRNA